MGAQMTITHVCWEQGVLHLIFHREYHFILLNFVLNMVQTQLKYSEGNQENTSPIVISFLISVYGLN